MQCISMRKYQIDHVIGSGNFSNVYKGVLVPENSPCAIKIMKSHHNIALREAQLLRKLKHPNIISIIEFQQSQNQSRIVMQYAGINTLELYESQCQGLKQQQVKCILFQTALGLSCVHSFGIIHRDIKPQNIIIDKKLAVIKLIDFGLAIEQNKCSTDYIATRWYRAPQNLLGTQQFSCAVDVFSLGCVIVQLYLGSPLFPGANNFDQVCKIFNILGYPTKQSWPKGYQKLKSLGINTDKKGLIDLKTIMNNCDPKLIDIVSRMLELNPHKRIKCNQILKNEYFKDIKFILPPFVFQRFQQDFLNLNKSISFKTINAVKSCKNISTVQQKYYKKFTRLNIANLKSKPKQQFKPVKNIQSPQFLRQKKSSSLSSVNEKSQKKEISKNKSKDKMIDAQNFNRKVSTPSLLSSSNRQNNLATKPKYNILLSSKQSENQKTLKSRSKSDKSKKKVQNIIIEQKVTLKQSNMAVSQTTTISQISKVTPTSPTSQQFEGKFVSGFCQTQNARNNNFPIIPNVKAVQNPDQNNPYTLRRRITSPEMPSLVYHQSQNQNNRRVKQTSIHCLNTSDAQKTKRPLKILDQPIVFYSLQTQNQGLASPKASQIARKEISKPNIKIYPQVRQQLPKYVLPSARFCPDNFKNKYQINNQKVKNQIAWNAPLSPSYRYFATSPQNKYFSKKMPEINQHSFQFLNCARYKV